MKFSTIDTFLKLFFLKGKFPRKLSLSLFTNFPQILIFHAHSTTFSPTFFYSRPRIARTFAPSANIKDFVKHIGHNVRVQPRQISPRGYYSSSISTKESSASTVNLFLTVTESIQTRLMDEKNRVIYRMIYHIYSRLPRGLRKPRLIREATIIPRRSRDTLLCPHSPFAVRVWRFGITEEESFVEELFYDEEAIVPRYSLLSIHRL